MKFDFHMHSCYSDGSANSETIFKFAKDNNFSAISITDHDTVLGIPEEDKLSIKYGIPYISAVEFTAFENGTKFHVLGYNIDENSNKLISYSNDLYKYTNEKSSKQIDLLNKAGFNIEKDEFYKECHGGPLYRAKMLKTLCRFGYLSENEIMSSLKRFFGENSICYVPDTYPYMNFESISNMIHEAGGKVVLAHPAKLKAKNCKLYMEVINSNLIDGLEVYHPSITDDVKNELLDIISSRNLLTTGGSDFHGVYNKLLTPIGGIDIPSRVYENLKCYLRNNDLGR